MLFSRFRPIVCASLFVLVALPVWGDRGCGEWVARGDGVLVTSGDVAELEQFYANLNILTDRGNYVKATVKFRLYSMEHDRLGLEYSELPVGDGGHTREGVQSGIEGNIRKAERYIQWVMEQHPVSDLVIESYFRSFPERFVDTDGTILALTGGVRTAIHRGIVARLKPRIDESAYAELKERYNVRICGEQAKGGGV